MSKIELMLKCPNCKMPVSPQNLYKLSSNDEKFKRQVFMDGICHQCTVDVLGWVGVGPRGLLVNYFPISLKHSAKWYARLDTDLIRERSVKIKDGLSRKRMKTVNGFKKERNSGKWMPQIQAVK